MYFSSFWISFDLPLIFNEANFFAWLDKNEAVSCGNSNLAFIENYKSISDTLTQIEKELRDAGIDESCSIYIIYKQDNKIVGKYIIKSNKEPFPIWKGYFKKDREDTIE